MNMDVQAVDRGRVRNSRAPHQPLDVRPRDYALKRKPMPPLEGPLAHAVRRTWRLRVAVGT